MTKRHISVCVAISCIVIKLVKLLAILISPDIKGPIVKAIASNYKPNVLKNLKALELEQMIFLLLLFNSIFNFLLVHVCNAI